MPTTDQPVESRLPDGSACHVLSTTTWPSGALKAGFPSFLLLDLLAKIACLHHRVDWLQIGLSFPQFESAKVGVTTLFLMNGDSQIHVVFLLAEILSQ